MNRKEIRIGVVPIGDIPEIAVKSLAAHITGYLDCEACILPSLSKPAYAFDRNRDQYNAASILKELESSPFPGYAKVVGLLNVDLFVPVFTHVFGEARQGGNRALVSLFRLRGKKRNYRPRMPLFFDRAAKVCLHELGHLFDLLHCADERCLMHFSGTLLELDRIPLRFCRYCSTYLQDAFERG
ncbi:MAG: archaemetzincin family Zn-dependent metalloprotease [Deltaproteobacteria bacterium]|nr:archaemetzincin family Zn-dependent metalloprotease [Deltaproteobacteria bacterium]